MFRCVAFSLLFPDATVVGVEHVRELVNLSKENISKNYSYLLRNGKIQIFHGDGRKGQEDFAPFDYIHSGAGNY